MPTHSKRMPATALRVLQIGPTVTNAGGTEAFTHRFTEALIAEGHQTLLVAPSADHLPGALYAIAPIPGLTELNEARQLRAREAVLGVARDFDPDVVVSHLTANSAVLDALVHHYRTIAFVHGFLCAGGKLFRRRDTLCTHRIGPRCLVDWYAGPCGSDKRPTVALAAYRRSKISVDVLRRASAVAVATTFMRTYAIGEGIPADRVHIVDVSEGLVTRGQANHRRGEDGRTMNLLFVGRISYNKGLQYLVRALALLDRQFTCVIVGDGWYLGAVQKLAAELHLAQRIRFLGPLHGDELNAQYERADALVVPSIWPEPAALVVPEAWQFGLPIIVTDGGGLPEWRLRYPDAIYVAQRADARSLASEIERMARERKTTERSFVEGVRPPSLTALTEAIARGR
jgi:glycosyltransferase involved in cell wall biosynthesis